MLDPWSTDSLLRTKNPKNIVINIVDAAHHLDLRASNPNDPKSVIEAREIEKAAIRTWINQQPSRADTSNAVSYRNAHYAIAINMILYLHGFINFD